MIKTKFGICPQCNDGKEKAILDGLCLYHYKKSKAEIYLQRKKERLKKKVLNGMDKKPTKAETIKKNLDHWFRFHMVHSKRVCENCGLSLAHYNQNDWFGCQHHVLEKSIFPTVAANISNHMVLGKWCCHNQWHSSYLNASNMKCFPRAKEIVRSLLPLLPPNELRKVNEVFLK